MESIFSGEDSTRLARPSGRAGARLGLILHIQTRNGEIEDCWDLNSTAVTMLHDKGLSPESTFSFDWHWRAESKEESRSIQCTASTWPRALKRLHDDFSKQVLDLLDLPFLIIFGACPRISHQKILDTRTKTVRVPIGPSGKHLEFWLDFSGLNGALRRIILCLPHPAMFHRLNGEILVSTAELLDQDLNCMMWLDGQRYKSCSMSKMTNTNNPKPFKGINFVELHAYRKRERLHGRALKVEELSAAFKNHAQNYLETDLLLLVNASLLIPDLVWEKMNAKRSISQATWQAEKRRSIRHDRRTENRKMEKRDQLYSTCSLSLQVTSSLSFSSSP
jgi:hypothetical protein